MKVHNIYPVSPVTSQQKAADPGIMLLGWLKRPAPRCPRLKCCDKLINRNPSLPVTPAQAGLLQPSHCVSCGILQQEISSHLGWEQIFEQKYLLLLVIVLMLADIKIFQSWHHPAPAPVAVCPDPVLVTHHNDYEIDNKFQQLQITGQ